MLRTPDAADAALAEFSAYHDYHRLHGELAWESPAERYEGTLFTGPRLRAHPGTGPSPGLADRADGRLTHVSTTPGTTPGRWCDRASPSGPILASSGAGRLASGQDEVGPGQLDSGDKPRIQHQRRSDDRDRSPSSSFASIRTRNQNACRQQ